MSPMWDHEEEHDSGTCAACQKPVEHGIVRWLPRMSNPDVRLILHPEGDEACTPSPCTEPRMIARYRP